LRTDQEIKRRGAQVDNEDDTVIEVDWTFSSGKTDKKRWLYFQDGVVIKGFAAKTPGQVLGRYSSNGDVASSVTPYGKGWVGLVGPHPEADKTWCKFLPTNQLVQGFANFDPDEDEEIENPEGIRYDIGHDFVEATIHGGEF